MAGTSRTITVTEALNEAPVSMFHLRAALTAGMGFFTDAYDLFIIGIAITILKSQWHLSAGQVGLLGSTSLVAAFVGAIAFGRLADVYGRKRIYGLEAAIMAVGAIASAFAPNITLLIIFRFILGIGIGGDYPVSAVLMSEYANRRNRGRLVSLVFSAQAIGLVVGPVVGLSLIGAGISHGIAWRIMLGLGALPAAAVIYFRRRMPESPRFVAQVRGDDGAAAASIATYSDGVLRPEGDTSEGYHSRRLTLGQFFTNPRYLLLLLGTAGTWFLFDYAYYGNAISTPLILKDVAPHAKLIQTLSWELLIFVVAAVPGYAFAVGFMDRIGHRRLQLIGFAIMGAAFAVIGIVPHFTALVIPFLIAYGISYFFAEFGPNTTTFVLSAEVYPASARATGHGMSAGIAKLGAFLGVFIFPILTTSLGLHGTLLLTGGLSFVGALLTLILPEPAGRSLESLSMQNGSARHVDAPALSTPSRSR